MATTVSLTYDDLVALQNRPENEFLRLELMGGELFVSPTPVLFHQRVVINVVYALEHLLRTGRPGVIYAAPVTVRLSSEDVVEPDIVYISQERLDIAGEKVIDGAPDLVMEVLSPGTRRRDLNQKRALYERFGVREYWVIDPTQRAVRRYTLIDGRYADETVRDGTVRSSVVPGFAMTLDDVFYPGA